MANLCAQIYVQLSDLAFVYACFYAEVIEALSDENATAEGTSYFV